MKRKYVKICFALVLFVLLTASMSINSFACVTGSMTNTDHEIVLNDLANYNKIKCYRSLDVTTSTVKGQNEMSWYTFVGNTQQLAYCNAVYGTSTVTVDGISSDFLTMIPKTTTNNIVGVNLYNYGNTCTALRQHNLDLMDVKAASKVVIYTPDGEKMTTYEKDLRMIG